ncbi:hypothetical protein D8T43_23115, partial [Vibrio vulnificus]|uniref:hypothetical protein n=1 Tax=Vibrio vulnificus TaxID=672 RepID=UPI0010EEA645
NKEAVASSIWLLFFLLECDSKLTHYHPNWLNFNSDNYPARGGPLVIPASLGATRNPFVDKRQNCGFLNEFPARSAQWILHHARTSLSRMTSVESGVWGAL